MRERSERHRLAAEREREKLGPGRIPQPRFRLLGLVQGPRRIPPSPPHLGERHQGPSGVADIDGDLGSPFERGSSCVHSSQVLKSVTSFEPHGEGECARHAELQCAIRDLDDPSAIALARNGDDRMGEAFGGRIGLTCAFEVPTDLFRVALGIPKPPREPVMELPAVVGSEPFVCDVSNETTSKRELRGSRSTPPRGQDADIHQTLQLFFGDVRLDGFDLGSSELSIEHGCGRAEPLKR